MIRVAYPGGAAAHSAAAAERLFREDRELVSLETFSDVVHAAVSGNVAYGVLPIENSLVGPVAETLRPVARVEHDRDIERAEAVEERRIESARRMREADFAHGAGRVRPPVVDGPVGLLHVSSQIAEEIEGKRLRRQEVGPQALVIEALMRFDEGRPCPCRTEGIRREQVRAGLVGVGERQTAADRSRRRTARSRCVRLRADGMSVRLAPLRLVVARSSAELGHLRSPRHAVVGFPAVRSL